MLQNKQFGELGEHVSHVLMRDLVDEVPDDAKSPEVIGHLHEGFDMNYAVDAGSILEDEEFDGTVEVKAQRVTETSGTPDQSLCSASGFSHKSKLHKCIDKRDGRRFLRQHDMYKIIVTTMRIDRGRLQRTPNSILVNLIARPGAGLTLRLSGKMPFVQRQARSRGKAFVLAPKDTEKVEKTCVGRSVGARGLQQKLDEHSAVLYRII